MSTATDVPRILRFYRMLEPLPLGKRIFSESFKIAAPYFRSIPAVVDSVRPGEVRVHMDDRRRVRNHLGTVHAIALCNLAELSMGAVAEVTVPSTHRWIPKGMQTEYLAKAKGRMQATATLDLPNPLLEKQDIVVPVHVTDPEGKEVFVARIQIWVTRKPIE
ncbi:hotdog fold domain-containing protein [Pendulispora albinea]|uniref:DUF4442 domain-containing protein n=1 Tax=Pendulispora albinea TaxID=2741071 RepID=A0ABZ2M7Y8_9BACT